VKWFLPSWNGDFRVEQNPNNSKISVLTMHEPTLAEQGALKVLGERFVKRKWCESSVLWNPEGKKEQHVDLGAPLSSVATEMAKQLKGGKQTLSAVRYSNGKVETVEGTEANLERFAQEVESSPEDPKAGVTVKRPTPCCPQCFEGAVDPATEVLLSFLTPEQHEQWAAERTLICYGGRTGYRYLLAHRHTPVARRMGKICCDVDNGIVVHFHDHSVPPEEEVLAAKLCLEHRESWLRNEATMLTRVGSGWATEFGNNHFKNPFGDGMDGVPDTQLTTGIGSVLLALGKVLSGANRGQS